MATYQSLFSVRQWVKEYPIHLNDIFTKKIPSNVFQVRKKKDIHSQQEFQLGTHQNPGLENQMLHLHCWNSVDLYGHVILNSLLALQNWHNSFCVTSHALHNTSHV